MHATLLTGPHRCTEFERNRFSHSRDLGTILAQHLPQPGPEPPAAVSVSTANAADSRAGHGSCDPLPEPIPGPSFLAVNLMDVMEAVRLTQLKLDKVSSDLIEVKQAVQILLLRDTRSPETLIRPTATIPQETQLDPVNRTTEQQRNNSHKSATSRTAQQQTTSERTVLIIGDSNVQRLQRSNDQRNISFRSVPGAKTEQIEHITKAIDDSTRNVVLHVGTNYLAHDGSEKIAKGLVRLAQQTRTSRGVEHVFICSVTPRKDLGPFVYSRSESVNNRLHSLCMTTAGVSFIDMRQQLDGCPFTGLAKDAVHYNKAGASAVLNKVIRSISDFL